MENKEKRPAEMETPSGTIEITLPDYNMFSFEEQEKAIKAIELIWMALQVNGLNDRDSDENRENTLPTMFSEIHGHISLLDFRCHMNGYERDYDPYNHDEYQIREIKLDGEEEMFFKNAESIRKWLHGILERMKP